MYKKLFYYSLSPFFVASAIFLFLQLQVYNLGLLFRDEGYLVFSAQRILSGELPYKDIFITSTPGSFYLQSLVMSFTTNYLIVDRILFIVFVVITLFFLNLIYKSSAASKYIVLITSAILLSGPSAIGYYNTEGFAIALISYYLLTQGLDNKSRSTLFLSGLFLGLVYFFKQSYGMWLALGFIAILLLERTSFPTKKERLLAVLFGAGVVPLFYVIYLIATNSLNQFLYYTFAFAKIVKSHREAFITKAIIGIPFLFLLFKLLPQKISKKIWLFSVGLVSLIIIYDNFSKLNYFEPSRIYYLIFIILPVWIIARLSSEKKHLSIRRLAIFFLCYFLANASSGRSIGVANISSVIFLPLVIEYLLTINNKRKYFSKKMLYATILLLVAFHTAYLSWETLSPKSTMGGIQKDKFDSKVDVSHAKDIIIPKNQKVELERLSRHINRYPADVKLLCFPYCPLLNVLVGRQSPSFFNLFYHETFLPENQAQVIQELKNSNSIVVIQKRGDIEPEADFEDQRLKVLKTYILKHYEKSLETENFTIYVQNKVQP